MIPRLSLFAAVLTGAVVAGGSPGFALSTKECSTKYQAAKSGGTLNGKSWNDFRKSECAGEAAAEDKSAAKVEPTGGAGTVFPKSVDAKYSKESAGRARMHTCLDQYKANKASGGNGGMKWIQKGGGYYSECNAALKK
jgi:hypothetical protein